MFGLLIQRSPMQPLNVAGWWELISTVPGRPLLRTYAHWRDGQSTRGYELAHQWEPDHAHR